MKIGEYEQMMSYLTKPETSSNVELHRSKGVLGKLNYGFNNLSEDLKAGKTTNQIANELYEKNKNFLDKYDSGRIQKLNPIVLVEQSLKDRIKKQPDFLKISNKNQQAYISKKENALNDFDSFIEKNKSKYKKMYDKNIAGAPEKFKQDLKSFLEKKYPEFIKESKGGTYITKGTKLFTPIKDLGREVTQAGDYGIEKYINKAIKESLGIPLKPKAGEGSSLDRLQRKYNLSTQQLLDAAKKQGIIPKKDPITGNPINSEDAYYRYIKRTEVDPIYNLFDKRFKFGAEHLGGISRAANIGDPQALTKITAIDPYVNRVLKGSNLDKKVSTQIDLAKQTGNKKYLNTANDLIKQGEKDFGLKLTKYKFENNKIVPVHPKVSMDDTIVKKAERAIKSFIATGRDKTKEFNLLPEDLKQSIRLFKQNNLPKARKFLNQAIKTGGVASVVGIAGLGLLGTEAEASGEEVEKKGASILPKAAAASSLAFKPIREGAKKFGKYALQVAGTPLGVAGVTAGFGVNPTQTLDRVALEAEAALAPSLVKGTEQITKNKILQRILNLGLSPARAMSIARVAQPIGVASLIGEGLYELGKRGVAEKAKLDAMTPEEKQSYLASEVEPLMDEGGMVDIGREGFADGPSDPSKRKFMKIMGGLASLPILGKFIKPAVKVAPAAVEAAKGMPAWFGSLVDKVIKEGVDVTKRFATKDREVVHVKQLGEAEGVRVTQDLETGKVTVDYDSPTNMGEQSVTFTYKPGYIDEDGSRIGPYFQASEVEPRGVRMGPDDYDIEFDGENLVESADELMSDTSSLKQFATGKLDDADLKLRQEKVKKVEAINNDQVEQAEYLETKYGAGDPDAYKQFPDDDL